MVSKETFSYNLTKGSKMRYHKFKDIIMKWAKELELFEPCPDNIRKENFTSYYEWFGIPENPKYFGLVKKIDLSFKSELRYIPDEFFHVFPNLIELNLSGTNIHHFPKPDYFKKLQKLHLEYCKENIVLPDEFMNLKELKSIKFGTPSLEILEVSEKLREWLLEKKLISDEKRLRNQRVFEPILINKEEYVINSTIVTITSQSVELITEETLRSEIKFYEYSNDSDLTLKVEGSLTRGSIHAYDRVTDSYLDLGIKTVIEMKTFSRYNRYMDLERTDGRISSFNGEYINISLYVPKKIILAIKEEFDKGKTNMDLSLLCNAYSTQHDDILPINIGLDLMLIGEHKATLAKYVMSRSL